MKAVATAVSAVSKPPYASGGVMGNLYLQGSDNEWQVNTYGRFKGFSG